MSHLHAYRCTCCGYIDWLTEDCSLYCPRCAFWPIERMRSKRIGAIRKWLQTLLVSTFGYTASEDGAKHRRRLRDGWP